MPARATVLQTSPASPEFVATGSPTQQASLFFCCTRFQTPSLVCPTLHLDEPLLQSFYYYFPTWLLYGKGVCADRVESRVYVRMINYTGRFHNLSSFKTHYRVPQ
ncbi:d1.2 [Ichnoviriform fugitivi]|uniref:D1.2 n=1 Tax=Ichnoviriform fugitivi TaxID=265522 RepID=A2Q0J1_9VIRU|nr:d1.2 [Ichnoviriform fugitivi]BAF45706.1 d1.2 [Ichnoviriform fugitivi]